MIIRHKQIKKCNAYNDDDDTAAEEIDFTQQIIGWDQCDGLITKCVPTKRMIYTLKFYQENDINKQNVFKEFKEKYQQILNDYSRFITIHLIMIRHNWSNYILI